MLSLRTLDSEGGCDFLVPHLVRCGVAAALPKGHTNLNRWPTCGLFCDGN